MFVLEEIFEREPRKKENDNCHRFPSLIHLDCLKYLPPICTSQFPILPAVHVFLLCF